MQRKIFMILMVLTAGLAMVSHSASAAEIEGLSVRPEVINVDSFFSGSELTVAGDIKATDDVIVEIYGRDATHEFEEKGRVGVFWMTTGKVKLENIPSLYVLMVPDGKEWLDKVAAFGLGMERVKSHLVISESHLDHDAVFSMFVKLKESEELYQENVGSVAYTPLKDGQKHFVGVCRLPSSISLGNYTVKVTVVSNGIPGQDVEGRLTVREVGFVKLVNELASNQRITYGVSAVVIALVAGLLMGVLFRQGGGSH
ncbi:MAG: TIGR02186 family protein [Desulfocapsaceae bacterium]|nr:TIGR02186 family protein [Desulfocapsaceae bacterium]